MDSKTKTASNIHEDILLTEEVKYALSEYNFSDEEAEKILKNYKSHISKESEYMELCNFCAFIDEQYHFLVNKGYPEEAVRKVIVENSKFIIRNNDYKRIILKYLGQEVEEHVYLRRPNLLILTPEVLYARYAFLNEYNQKAQLEGKKTYSFYSVESGNNIESYFKTSDSNLRLIYPIPGDIKLELRYPDDPKKREFIKSMLLQAARRKAQNNE